MAHRKQRVFQHIMEDDSYKIIKDLIPKEWVIREFNRPDYGIDLVIELFDKINDKVSETLGEFLFIQVKSIQELNIKKEKTFAVNNVAKGYWEEDKSEFIEIEVIKYLIDTNTIFSIQSLGSSVSVLLFLVDIKTKSVFFICLNDYIDKIILPKTPDYAKSDTITLNVPIINNLKNTEVCNAALCLYGKRAKLLAAFSRFSYQGHELAYLLNFRNLSKDFPCDEKGYIIDISSNKIVLQVNYFIEQIENLDIWGYQEWQPLPLAKQLILTLKNHLINNDIEFNILITEIISTWRNLTHLGCMYEDLIREWFLPKFISVMVSYPKSQQPKIIKNIK